jgi:hypothetical protein
MRNLDVLLHGGEPLRLTSATAPTLAVPSSPGQACGCNFPTQPSFSQSQLPSTAKIIIDFTFAQ